MTVVVPNVPTPVPSRADPLNFAARADAYHTALPITVDALNLQNAENNSLNAAVNATAAAVAMTANVTAWSATTAYAVGNCVFDTTNFLTYRRKVAGTTATRPGLDTTNWALLTGFGDVTTTGTQTLTNKTFGDNPIFSAGTANGILYLNGSKVATSGSALTFDGTNLGVGVSAMANAGLTLAPTFNLSFANNSTSSYSNIYLRQSDNSAVIGSGVSRSASYDYTSSYGATWAPTAITVGNGLIAFGTRSAGTVAFGSDAGILERMRIDASGRLLIGTSSARTNLFGTSASARVFLEGTTTADDSRFVIIRNSTTTATNGGSLFLGASKGTTVGSVTAVASGDRLGGLEFLGADGTALQTSAQVQAFVDGAVSTGVVPGRLVLSTATSAGVLTERMRIDSSGNVGIGTSTPSSILTLKAAQAPITTSWLAVRADGAAYTAGGIESSFVTRDGNTNIGGFVRILDVNTNPSFPTTIRGGAVSFGTVDGSSGQGVSATERMRLDSRGNLGLGAVPSSWGSNYRAFQIELGGAIWSDTRSAQRGNIGINANVYNDNTDNRYIGAGKAARYMVRGDSGSHEWFIAPTGIADGVTTFTQAMTLDNSGNLGIGVVPGTWGSSLKALQLGSGAAVYSSGLSIGISSNIRSDSNTVYLNNGFASSYYQVNGTHQWNVAVSGTAGNTVTFTQAMTLDNSGNLAIGTTAASTERLTVSGSSDTFLVSMSLNNSESSSAISLMATGSAFSNANYPDVPDTAIVRSGANTSGGLVLMTSNATSPIKFFTNNTSQRMVIDTSGNVGLGTDSAAGVRLNIEYNTNTYAGVRLLNRSASNTSGGATLGLFNDDGAAMASGDRLSAITFGGSLDAVGTTAATAGISASADALFTGTSAPTSLKFETTASGSVVRAERARITSDGYLRMASGSGGIQFNGNTAAANALDDYEEGTWTTTFTYSNASAATLSDATYTKIGRLVTLSGKLSATLTTTGTAVAVGFILPFSQRANITPAVGSANHTLTATVYAGLSQITDSSLSTNNSASFIAPASQVTKANGSAFTVDFSYTYETT